MNISKILPVIGLAGIMSFASASNQKVEFSIEQGQRGPAAANVVTL